ncbi:MAG TPA: PQQ-binding-like beta-propeller repeat protein [Anaeromyxobacteraceae bacterium]|nr:PQQ-binding-like beta-propeller repeat protein [Anaeromyxobacteraceae bacterium]
MVRIRIGAGWRHDPALRGALREARSASDRAQAVRRIVDVMAIEVDGVDIAAGRAEGPVLASVEELLRALTRLVAGDGQASVAFQDGTVELVLRRRGGSALLSVVALGRPTRLLARDVEVDLDALAGAAREAAGDLASDLSSLAGPTAAARRLLAIAARLASSRAEPGSPGLSAPARARRARRRPAAPSCGFEIADEEGLVAAYRGPGADLASLLVPGRVVLRGASGTEVFSIAGSPLLVLGDLVAAAGRLLAAALAGEPQFEFAVAPAGRGAPLPIRVDLSRGTVSAGARPGVPAPPLALAQAFLEAALDFCAVVLARNPRQAENPHLGELRDLAAERLAHLREAAAGDLVGRGRTGVRSKRAPSPPRAPLGPGQVRKLRFRLAWQASVGPPVGPGLVRRGDLLVALGREALLGLDAVTGRPRWRVPGAEGGADLGDVLLAASGDRLACLEIQSGRERWRRPLPDLARGLAWGFRLPAGLCAVPAGPGLAALDLASGRVAWRFAPPAAESSWGSPFGAVSLLGADTGLVYGLDGSGALAWRLRAPGPLLAAPSTWAGDCLLVCRTERGGSLLAVDPAVGRRRWEAPLDFSPGGPALPFAGRLAVPGLVAGDAVVAAFEGDGAPAFTLAPSLGTGALALATWRGGLLAKGAGGTCAAFDRGGATRWTHAHESPHPPPGNLPPILVRGVALVPSEGVQALDEETGRLVGHVPGMAPARLLAGEDLSLHAVDAEGLVTAVRLEAHLSLLS